MDLTEGQPAGHCLRAAWIAYFVADARGQRGRARSDVYYTALLKDLGCSSNAARICQLYLTDDINFKRDFKTIDTSLSAALRFVFAKTGLESGLSERIRALVHVIQNGGEIGRELIESRCHRGADIAAKMRFSETVQDGIRGLDEHWDGGGQPEGLRGPAIPAAANISLLAQVADVFHQEFGIEAAIAEVGKRSGSWFDPALVDAFMLAQQRPGFWEALCDPHLRRRAEDLDLGSAAVTVDDDYLDDIASAFSDIVDAKSPFTADHSNRVTLYSDMIAEGLGFDAGQRRWLRRAALLHDVGKLAISNQILDKPGKLDAAEWEAIRSHPRLSREILARVAAFADLAPVAGAHHEKLDGSGYPDGLKGDEICLEARILTVADVFDALSAERPYRAAMSIEKAFAILDEETGTSFDPRCVAALKRGLARLKTEDSAA
ncbi:HD-GYP domain-containing protein [Pseudohoeflea coraliihabitans]|uniref:HD-GYP domain-containing protein n=1 Tax=Pseudohoeflea coraliihabitans TaxID=2860393 RepID=UPI00210307AB|nr:HD domain-containing protein [Pseudohoeflea sp. DP4N28-3]